MMASTSDAVHFRNTENHSHLQEFLVIKNYYNTNNFNFTETTSYQAVPDKSLGEVAKQWSNLTKEQFLGGWKFQLTGHPEPVGYIPDKFVQEAVWDSELFDKVDSTKSIVLKPNPRCVTRGESIEYGISGPRAQGKDVPKFNIAIINFCEDNKVAPNFKAGLGPWFEKAKKFRSIEEMEKTNDLDYHPILTSVIGWEGLKVPSPIRGILGILTTGIHMNAYTMSRVGGEDTIDKIWVSKRPSDKSAYPSCYDQIVAGGMEVEDERDPWRTVHREAREEAGYKLSKNENTGATEIYAIAQDTYAGDITEGSHVIYFHTLKDTLAGASENRHIEPGIRYCFDLQLLPDQTPNANEGQGFHALTVDQIKESLKKGEWKPNSGLVMLDFLARKGLLDQRDARVIESLRHEKSFLFVPQFKE